MKIKESFDRFLPDRPEHGCWEWRGPRNHQGYGLVSHNGRGWRAHRAAYELFVGPIPQGAGILHNCDNPPCCRPDHLRPGTAQDNAADKMAKGRHNHALHRAGTPIMTSAARQRLLVERRKNGLIVLDIVCPEVDTIEYLVATGFLDQRDPTRQQLSDALSRWIYAEMTRQQQERWPML